MIQKAHQGASSTLLKNHFLFSTFLYSSSPHFDCDLTSKKCAKRPKLKPTRRSFTSKHNISMQKNPKTTKPPLYSAVESAATPFQSTNAPKATPFLEQNRQEPHHRHRDLEAAINRLSDELSQQRKALDKLTQKIEEEKEYQLAADRARDRMIRALEDPLKSVYSADWNKYLRGYGILNRT